MEQKITQWRLIPFSCHDPYENMAIDEVLTESYKKSLQPILRIYAWNPHGFSFGYFQNPDQFLNIDLCLQNNIPFVRRTTGGGCIYHGEGITYSMILSYKDLLLPRNIKESYRSLCEFIIQFYSKLHLNAEFAIQSSIHKNTLGIHSDICFSNSQHYDITINKKKIGGNAQRRKKELIFQHGFIPTKTHIDMYSKYCKKTIPQFYSLEDVTKLAHTPRELAELLKDSFTKHFDIPFTTNTLTQDEKEQISYLLNNKYLKDSWNINYKKNLCNL